MVCIAGCKKLIRTVYNFVILFNSTTNGGSPGFFGIWGEGLFIFRELRSTGNYFRGAREQPHNFRESYTKVKKNIKNPTVKVNPPFCFCFFPQKISLVSFIKLKHAGLTW